MRPININPLTIRLPVMALVSIAHRVSGVLVFLLIPILLWTLERSLASPEGLAQVKETLETPWWKITWWALIASFIFHFFAGARHLLMDSHIGDSLFWGAMGSKNRHRAFRVDARRSILVVGII